MSRRRRDKSKENPTYSSSEESEKSNWPHDELRHISQDASTDEAGATKPPFYASPEYRKEDASDIYQMLFEMTLKDLQDIKADRLEVLLVQTTLPLHQTKPENLQKILEWRRDFKHHQDLEKMDLAIEGKDKMIDEMTRKLQELTIAQTTSTQVQQTIGSRNVQQETSDIEILGAASGNDQTSTQPPKTKQTLPPTTLENIIPKKTYASKDQQQTKSNIAQTKSSWAPSAFLNTDPEQMLNFPKPKIQTSQPLGMPFQIPYAPVSYGHYSAGNQQHQDRGPGVIPKYPSTKRSLFPNQMETPMTNVTTTLSRRKPRPRDPEGIQFRQTCNPEDYRHMSPDPRERKRPRNYDGLKFDESGDPHQFLANFVEWCRSQTSSNSDILWQVVPQILKGRALDWWRNNIANIHTVEQFIYDFLTQYAPIKDKSSYKRDLEKRHQVKGEPNAAFCRSITGLFHAIYEERLPPADEIIDTIRRKATERFRMLLLSRDVNTVEEVLTLAFKLDGDDQEIKASNRGERRYMKAEHPKYGPGLVQITNLVEFGLLDKKEIERFKQHEKDFPEQPFVPQYKKRGKTSFYKNKYKNYQGKGAQNPEQRTTVDNKSKEKSYTAFRPNPTAATYQRPPSERYSNPQRFPSSNKKTTAAAALPTRSSDATTKNKKRNTKKHRKKKRFTKLRTAETVQTSEQSNSDDSKATTEHETENSSDSYGNSESASEDSDQKNP